jgi:L,D-transpeptidase YcbB
VRQIELSMERLRWLPRLDPERLLVVNIPTFRLVAWNADRAGPPALTMGVVVGRALDRETPVFAEEMTHVIFRPYWNVPRSIARNEILPAVRRDPGYLRKNDMEVVAGPSDGSPVAAATAANLALVAQGRLRIRQRPGAENALGRVKFVFPNDADVYMHGTPAVALFQRSRRDFSHGCIRVEDPVALAEWVLSGQDGWSRERILEAMEGPPSQRVDLARPLQVILFYVTAVVVAQEGAIHFADDVYGHDARLERALAGRGR